MANQPVAQRLASRPDLTIDDLTFRWRCGKLFRELELHSEVSSGVRGTFCDKEFVSRRAMERVSARAYLDLG